MGNRRGICISREQLSGPHSKWMSRCNAHSYMTILSYISSLGCLIHKTELITGIPQLPSVVIIKFKMLDLKHFLTLSRLWAF